MLLDTLTEDHARWSLAMDRVLHFTPIVDGVEAVRYGSVQTVEYRDTVTGVRFTVHHAASDGGWWITRHGPTDRNDTDGPAVARTAITPSADVINAAWKIIRHTQWTV